MTLKELLTFIGLRYHEIQAVTNRLIPSDSCKYRKMQFNDYFDERSDLRDQICEFVGLSPEILKNHTLLELLQMHTTYVRSQR